MSGRPLVYVVVLNCNGQAVVGDCLSTLLASDYPGLRVCVVDNASTDGSPDWIAQHFPAVEVIRNGENLGWSGANNTGIRHALARGADFVWILNNDVEVEPDCVRRLVEYAGPRERLGIVGPLIYYFEPRRQIWFPGGRIDFDAFTADHTAGVEAFRALPQTARYVSGCALMVRREVFERIGLIDERFFIYFEDVDFCLRAAQAGFELDVEEGARMVHKVSAFSGGAESASPWKAYYTLRSGLLFWRKHLGWWRFHRSFCRAQLGKWVLSPHFDKTENGRRAWADAIMDAFWYYLSGKRSPRSWPRAPAWFRSIMLRRPWLVAECMAFRFGPLLLPGLR